MLNCYGCVLVTVLPGETSVTELQTHHTGSKYMLETLYLYPKAIIRKKNQLRISVMGSNVQSELTPCPLKSNRIKMSVRVQCESKVLMVHVLCIVQILIFQLQYRYPMLLT